MALLRFAWRPTLWHVRLLCLACIVGVALPTGSPRIALAATTYYVATTGSDSNDCLSTGTPCATISAAIARSASGDTINIAAGVYTETISITESLTLIGAGVEQTIIDGGQQGTVVSVGASSDVTISGVTIQHGIGNANTGGGGIYNAGSLTLSDSAVISNTSPGMKDSYMSGDGIANTGSLTITSSTVSGNDSPTSAMYDDSGGGGGIANRGGDVTVIGSSIMSNTATYGGGGIASTGTVTITTSTVAYNSAPYGGAIDNQGSMALSDGMVRGNVGTTGAGGIFNEYGSTVLTVTNSTISANSAVGSEGGGLENAGGLVRVTDSAVTGNSAYDGGGINVDNGGATELINSTVSGNTATYSGGGVNNFGNASSTLALTDTTVSGNSAGMYGGGLRTFNTGPVSIANTILAGNSVASGMGPDCYGPLISHGYDLLGVNANCSGLTSGVNGDSAGTAALPLDPQLGPLRSNGGATETMVPLPGSPAIDAIPANNCPLNTDQRGQPRPDEPDDNGACDIGAFESQGVRPAAGIVISPTNAAAFQSVVMTGTNFGASEPVDVYLDNTGTTPCTVTTSAADGSFIATFTVPQAISGTHILIAVGQSSGITASAPLLVHPRTYLGRYVVMPGSKDVLVGTGFAPNEHVLAYWSKPGGALLGSSYTNSQGTFAGAQAITFTVPMSIFGVYQVYTVGQSSGAIVQSTLIS